MAVLSYGAFANRPVKSLTLGIVVIRADGRHEDRGIVASYRIPWWKLFKAICLNEAGLAVLQVNAGRAIVTGRLQGTAQAVPNQGGWGTGAGTTAATDTTLFVEDSGGSPAYARVVATQTQVTTTTTNDTAQAVYTITANAAKTITNAGLFDAASVGNMWLKGDFAGVALNQNDSIQFTFKCQYS